MNYYPLSANKHAIIISGHIIPLAVGEAVRSISDKDYLVRK